MGKTDALSVLAASLIVLGSQAAAQTLSAGEQADELFAPPGGAVPRTATASSVDAEPPPAASAAAPVPGGVVDNPRRLPRAVSALLKKQGLPASSLSVFVQAVDAPAPSLRFNAGALRNPASVMKLVTTLSSLETLGPAHMWTTRLYADAPVRDGRLDGNLYIRGGGDPWMVGERFWRMLRELRNTGLREIRGDVVIDNGYFAVPRSQPGAFDGQRWRAYNVVPAAFNVNFRATTFSMRPDAAGKRVNITLDPPNARIKVNSALQLRTKGRCRGAHRRVRLDVKETAAGATVKFSGRYPLRCGHTTLLRSVIHSELYDMGVMEALWAEMGGTIGGGVRTGSVPARADAVLDWASEPLANAIRGMNKYSNNVMTRTMLLTLGAVRFGEPGTLANGRRAVTEFLAHTGINTGGFVVDNGSGLSREARISADQLGQMLVSAWRSPYAPEFVSSLSLSAMDGTLRRRFRDSDIAGRAHMKTGLLRGVRSLAGYLMDASGRTHVVVILQNHPRVNGKSARLQQALLESVYGG